MLDLCGTGEPNGLAPLSCGGTGGLGGGPGLSLGWEEEKGDWTRLETISDGLGGSTGALLLPAAFVGTGDPPGWSGGGGLGGCMEGGLESEACCGLAITGGSLANTSRKTEMNVITLYLSQDSGQETKYG